MGTYENKRNEWGVTMTAAAALYSRLHGHTLNAQETREFWRNVSPMMLWMDAISAMRSKNPDVRSVTRLTGWAEANRGSEHLPRMTPLPANIDAKAPVLQYAVRYFNRLLAESKGESQ